MVYVVDPFYWILLFLVLHFITKNKKFKKRYLITALVLFLIFSNKILFSQFANYWDIEKSELETNKTYSCAIVLGGMASENKDSKGFFNGSADRFIQALKLKQTGKVDHLLISGGNNKLNPGSFIESEFVINELKTLHVPDSALLIETKSRNTQENATLTKATLEGKKLPPPYVLVTSAFHMRRALLTFKKAGVPVLAYPGNFTTGKGNITFDYFIPSLEPLGGWARYLKEVAAYSFLKLKS